jgi:hypothetical protein
VLAYYTTIVSMRHVFRRTNRFKLTNSVIGHNE